MDNMIINFKLVEQHTAALGIKTFATYTDEEAELYLFDDALKVWNTCKTNYPDFYFLMNTAGHLLSYSICVGFTIQLLKKKMNLYQHKLDQLVYQMLRKVYISPNLFNEDYYSILLNKQKNSFSPEFIDIITNEHNLVFDKLQKYWQDKFPQYIKLHSSIIEKVVSLVAQEQKSINDSIKNGISEIAAQEEASKMIQDALQ